VACVTGTPWRSWLGRDTRALETAEQFLIDDGRAVREGDKGADE
jgi:hypothetical protein